MSQVIGRVTTGTYETVRGPDVTHRVRVEREWLLNGQLVEFELPRNLSCAACEGGGCDRCGRSGAIALRGRDEPAEFVQVTLPTRTAAEVADQPCVVLRVPGFGGKYEGDSVEARGLLLLRVVASAAADPGVKLAHEAHTKKRLRKSKRPTEAVAPGASVSSNRLGVFALLLTLAWIVLTLVASATLTR